MLRSSTASSSSAKCALLFLFFVSNGEVGVGGSSASWELRGLRRVRDGLEVDVVSDPLSEAPECVRLCRVVISYVQQQVKEESKF